MAAAAPAVRKHHFYTPVVWDAAGKQWQNIPLADFKGNARYKGTTHSQAASKYANSQRCTVRKGGTFHMLRLGTRGADVRSYKLEGYDIVAAPAIMVGVSTVRRAKLTTVTTPHKPAPKAPAKPKATPKPPAYRRPGGPMPHRRMGKGRKSVPK